MKKITILLTIFMAIVLSGCGCKHEWEEATCDKAKTCKLCGETEGEPLGHLWSEASCENPRKCTRCGKTDGEALGHKWEDATCTEPKKCSVCGKTEGEALGHDFAPATLDAPETCRVCGETEGEPITFRSVDLSFLEGAVYNYIISDNLCVAVTRREDNPTCLNVTFYDFDGNKVNEQTLDIKNPDGSWNGYCWSFVNDGYLLATGNESKVDITIYNYNGEPVLEKRLEGSDFFDNFNNKNRVIQLDGVSFDGINRVYSIADKTYFGVDFNNRRECSPDEYFTAALEHGVNPDYDTSKWSSHVYDETINGYLVETADGSFWGYVDLGDNEIKLFKDATTFTSSGYTLVSNDCKTYDLIDTDMNVIAENVVEGIGVSHFLNSDVFRVYSEDGSYAFYVIH